MKFHNSLGFVLGSALLMLSLFLPLLWNFIPCDIIWVFPFFDESTKSFSFSPRELRTYPLQTIAPFYFTYILIPIYIASKALIHDMVVSITEKIKVNLWTFHSVYMSLLAIDLFLSFSQTPYFRTFFIVVGCVLQVRWLVDNTR